MGTLTARRRASALALVVGLLASLVVALVPAAPAQAANGKVVGEVIGSQGRGVNVKMLWFDKDWRYLGARRVQGNIYSLSLKPGTYHLQFVDQRPSYDVTKYAPSDVRVVVRSGVVVQRNVKMRRGAAITGTVRAGGRTAGGARVVAANGNEQSYEVKANRKGQFAIGGLPAGSYSVFTFDRQETWVGKSLWVPGLKRGQASNVRIALTKRGGSLLVQLRRPDGGKMPGSFFVTAVSKVTGQFWTQRARRGEVAFRNLFPGGYRLVAPGVGNYFARTANIQGARVHAGRADLASSFRWSQRGAWITGTVVDEADAETPMARAQVMLFDKFGTKLDETSTSSSGRFTLDGQLATQSGLKIVVNPEPNGGGWMAGAEWCQFEGTTSGPWSVFTGEQLPIDEPILLPHRITKDTSEQCLV
ncbi:carboxypeptidase-like regulatory domain-containing protein [Nocardioides sp. SOB77]|uniref:Carboxypeptidase-like regulatory domain-containing protein n=1 Tax=Nocardioides oceani TaxID=3058369 RepID=A0ABT8FH39_9ACTN|nr:carboxypeptidase-like regulatory domain-containing protein [Nocardioides oceani]MDN4173861.1 carboxypeptidase-like regulatory domain-containing protein [Nocardioides oceani]